MSNVSAFGNPASDAIRAAPTTPAAGPESNAKAACSRGFLERGEAAGGAHDERRQETCARAGRSEGAEVSAQDRAEVRVDHRRRRPLVLAELGSDLVGGDDVGAGMAAAKLGCDRLLVAVVPESEEETDGDRLRVELGKRCEIERLQLSVPPDATAHADRALERNERLRMLRAGPVQVRTGLAP